MKRVERTDERTPSIVDEVGNNQTYDTITMYDTTIDSSFVSIINSIKTSINKTELSGIKIGKNGEITMSTPVTPKRKIDKTTDHNTPEHNKASGKKPRKM